MDEKLKWFIGDLYEFVGTGSWNQFKDYCKEKGYNSQEITDLEEKLGEWLGM